MTAGACGRSRWARRPGRAAAGSKRRRAQTMARHAPRFPGAPAELPAITPGRGARARPRLSGRTCPCTQQVGAAAPQRLPKCHHRGGGARGAEEWPAAARVATACAVLLPPSQRAPVQLTSRSPRPAPPALEGPHKHAERFEEACGAGQGQASHCAAGRWPQVHSAPPPGGGAGQLQLRLVAAGAGTQASTHCPPRPGRQRAAAVEACAERSAGAATARRRGDSTAAALVQRHWQARQRR